MEILRNSFKKEENLKILSEYDYHIYYSCTYKYPLLTVERLQNANTKNKKLNLEDIKYPLSINDKISNNHQMNISNYKDYMEYGGSLCPNLSALNNKNSIEQYLSIFKISYFCPQEITFNTSLWFLLEYWCHNLYKEIVPDNKKIKDIFILTGNIPNLLESTFNQSKINIPTHLFKIVCCYLDDNSDDMYIGCFLMPNQAPIDKIHKLYKYLVNLNKLSYLCDIDLLNVIKKYVKYYYNKDIINIKSLKNLVRIDIHLKDNFFLIRQMHSSQWYRNLIYSKNITELEKHWKNAKNNDFGDEYHYVYYCLAKNRIKKNKEIRTPISNESYLRNKYNTRNCVNSVNNTHVRNNIFSNDKESTIENRIVHKNIYHYLDSDKTKKRKPLQIKKRSKKN
tara:strand:- start:287 stop:1468 length:1182 start_codon:yes stop_codon:yes gene_type:complete